MGLALGIAAALAAPAGAASITCPSQIQVEQRAAPPPAGMTMFDREPSHRWVNVAFSDGPPEEQAWLAPDATSRSGAALVNTWHFAPSSSSGTWLACGYTGTSLVAAKRLPDTLRTCRVRYDPAVSPPAATAIDCQ